ncbi:MAG: hypothetical protein R3C11_29295 [Planctomycetaceae bacterium]
MRSRQVKQQIDGETLFFCCEKCIDQYTANEHGESADIKPAKLPRQIPKAVARQRLCPVMEEPLDAMGGPWKIIVEGNQYMSAVKVVWNQFRRNLVNILRVQKLTEQTERK